jgi:ADP-ribose pyrophosphatase YjhB (NUDIX family)
MISKKEVQQLQKLIGKIEHPELGLPQGVFDPLCKIVPFVGPELVVVNNKKEILLIYRDDGFWKGWHFPGGLLRFNETMDQRLKAVAKKELGVTIKKSEFLFHNDYIKNPRGHDVSLMYLCAIKGEPKNGKFFKQMPKDIIPQHKIVWKKLIKFL